MTTVPAKRLLLGVDGGGSKTDAMLAVPEADGSFRVLGRAQSGPSNLRLAGQAVALYSLESAVSQALDEGGMSGKQVDHAVLGLAGSTDADVHAQLEQWAARSAYFKRFSIIHDAEPVLMAGTPAGVGIAMIVGTGSVVTGVDRHGRSRTRGGWGHWFGDAGSGYDIGRRALAVASAMDDGVGPSSVIHERLLLHFGIARLRSVMQVLATAVDVRARMAAVAPVVMQAAEEGDEVALGILREGAHQMAQTAHSVVRSLDFEEGFAMAMAGSVICRNPVYRDLILGRMGQLTPRPGVATPVHEPVLGCLQIASLEIQEE